MVGLVANSAPACVNAVANTEPFGALAKEAKEAIIGLDGCRMKSTGTG